MTQRNANEPQISPQKQPRREDREGTTSMEPRRRMGELARPGSPFSFMRRFMGEMDRLFEDFGFGPRHAEMLPRGVWAPQMDVFERDGQLIVHADLPGLRDEDVQVTIDQGMLTISGERSHEHEHEKGGVHQCERAYGSFQRSIALPEGVDPEGIQANFENGVLEVTMPLPKQEQQKPKGRSIPIGAKGVRH